MLAAEEKMLLALGLRGFLAAEERQLLAAEE